MHHHTAVTIKSNVCVAGATAAAARGGGVTQFGSVLTFFYAISRGGLAVSLKLVGKLGLFMLVGKRARCKLKSRREFVVVSR